MKQIAIILTAILITSCLNLDERHGDLVPVRFRLDGVRSGALTKATDNELQAAVDSACAFTTPEITLTSTTDPTKIYTASVGEQTYLPVGTYMASASIEGPQATTCPFGSVYATPSLTVEQEVVVTGTTHTISLAAQPACFALILDRATTQQYRIEHDYCVDGLSIFPAEDGASVVFVKPSAQYTTSCVATLIARASVGGGERTYPVSWAWGNGGTHFTVGNWYCFHGSVSGVDADIELTCGPFACGYNAN